MFNIQSEAGRTNSATASSGYLEIRSAISAENLGLSLFRASAFKKVRHAHSGYSSRFAASVRAENARTGCSADNPANGSFSTRKSSAFPLNSRAFASMLSRGSSRSAECSVSVLTEPPRPSIDSAAFSAYSGFHSVAKLCSFLVSASKSKVNLHPLFANQRRRFKLAHALRSSNSASSSSSHLVRP